MKAAHGNSHGEGVYDAARNHGDCKRYETDRLHHVRSLNIPLDPVGFRELHFERSPKHIG
jgi:hypothetical protein